MRTEATPHIVDVQAFIDAQRVSPLQKLLLFLCVLIIAVDGFDTVIVGFIAPAIRATPYRATGVVWANGIGRSGSIAGSRVHLETL